MKIYLHDNSSGFRLCLFGDLNETAAAELERCWRGALSIVDGRTIRVDGTGLNSVTDAGRRLLGRMTLAGTRVNADWSSPALGLLSFLGPALEKSGQEPDASILHRTSTAVRRLWSA
jgi:hypothetical protein